MKFRWAIVWLVLMSTSGLAAANDKAAPGKDKAAAAKIEAGRTATGGAAKAGPAEAAAGDAAKAGPAEPEADDTAEDAFAGVPHIVGPRQVELGHHAQIDLPAGMTLLEQAQAQDLLRKGGNDVDGVVAVILPPPGTADWIVVVEAEDVGYVSDDDADDIDAAGMLEQFKQGTLAQNKKRAAMGVPELFLDGWSEQPRYERLKHHLVWGLNGHDSGGKIVNFFTRLLGRHGYLSVDLIDEPSQIEASKQHALSILTALHFADGARYQDHVDGDKSSGLGLQALMLGGAGVVIAKKTGILIAILLVLKKGFIVVIAAVAGFFRWLFRRKKASDDVVPAPPSEPPPEEPPQVG